ncbi:winged helix-turn-helix transcriptional regulator [Candidatus Bathyarchaeota archaeon]|nr:winged helix-turn-helix transcriptional regulator [Candidatus Bathyarchaeota archaeon]
MKYSKTITDPEAFQLLSDETRRKIIFLLRVKEMTVSQLAEELGLTPQAVYHHIKKLQKGDMVEVTREERIGHLLESYYKATAEVFSFSIGKEHVKTSKDRKIIVEQETNALNALKRLGFKIGFTEADVSKLVDLISELNECCESEEYEEKLSKMDDLDVFTKLRVKEYAEILSISDEEYAKLEKKKREIRNLLNSLVRK